MKMIKHGVYVIDQVRELLIEVLSADELTKISFDDIVSH